MKTLERIYPIEGFQIIFHFFKTLFEQIVPSLTVVVNKSKKTVR